MHVSGWGYMGHLCIASPFHCKSKPSPNKVFTLRERSDSFTKYEFCHRLEGKP